MSTLKQRFAQAGLEVEICAEPIRRVGDRDVFQMDIAADADGGRPRECFRLWKGGEENRVEVAAVDPAREQLVLLVQEPGRVFSRSLGKLEIRAATRFAAANGRTLPEQLRFDNPNGTLLRCNPEEHAVVLEQRTSREIRHYLVGMDETHLFIAQVPRRVSSVAAAHEALKGETVAQSGRRRPGGRARKARLIRQGEWFFLPSGEGERAVIARALRRSTACLTTHSPIEERRGGKPHIAAERLVLRFDEENAPAPGVEGRTIYVRGRVTHPDHRVVRLKAWHRAVLNAEVHEESPGGIRVSVLWVD